MILPVDAFKVPVLLWTILLLQQMIKDNWDLHSGMTCSLHGVKLFFSFMLLKTEEWDISVGNYMVNWKILYLNRSDVDI